MSYDAIIVGAGPAGYVAALRCAQLGLKTACVDAWQDRNGTAVPGGTCLNAGCIPSKALLESSEFYEKIHRNGKLHGISVIDAALDVPALMDRKEAIVRDLTTGIATLFKVNGVEWIAGRARLQPDRRVEVTAHDGNTNVIEAAHVILAPGSIPVDIDAAPLQDDIIVDSSGALAWDSVPGRLGIIGAGVIGLELGSVWRRLGAEVTLLEAQQVFLSMADQQIARTGLKLFRQQDLDIRLGALVKSTRVKGGLVTLEYQDSDGAHSLEFDRLIVAVGRRPCTDGLASEEAGLLLDEGGFIHVDADCSTSLPGVYAIGDAVRGPMLAHKGSEEGMAVAERIAGQTVEVNYDAIPSVIYTQPEIAWVGKTEEALRGSGTEFTSGLFPFAASGRARAMQATEGMVKLLSDAASDRVLGVHIIGAHASELIAQAVITMEFGGCSEDIARTVFAHPTLSEALHEAALDVDGRAIHVAKTRRS